MNKHRASISLWTMAAAILALGITAAPAQQVPAGSYQRICSNISVAAQLSTPTARRSISSPSARACPTSPHA